MYELKKIEYICWDRALVLWNKNLLGCVLTKVEKHWDRGKSRKSSTYFLTYSMVQSPSWEANWFAAGQEIPRISRNPKVHYRTHKRPPPVSILGQPNPVHIPTSHLLEIHPNIIHPSTPMSLQWSPSLRFSHQDPKHLSSHPYAPHAQPISFFSILPPSQ